jgi:hypothetical protein
MNHMRIPTRSPGLSRLIDASPMATPNCSTYGRSNCSRQDGSDYDDSVVKAMRAAASSKR